MAHKNRLPKIYLIILAMTFMLAVPQVAHAAKYLYTTYTDPGITVTLKSYSSIDVSVAYNLTQVGSGQPADLANTITVQWVTSGSGWGSPNTSGAMDASQANAGSYAYAYKITGLSASTSYDIRVIHADADGVGQAGSPYTATTSSITDTTNSAPVNDTTVDTLTSTGQTDTTVSLQSTYSGDANDSNSATFEWSLAGQASWNTISGPNVTRGTKTWTATASSLLPGTLYDFRVSYSDGEGVSGSPKTLSSVSTTYTGLGVGTISAGTATDTTMVVNAPVDSANSDTNTNATVQYEYKLTSEPTIWTNYSTAVSAKTNQSMTVTGLTTNTSYDFRVTWTDANGIYDQSTKASLGSPYTPTYVTKSTTTGVVCVNTLSDCGDCHGMPPVDYSGGDPTGTTRRPGDHDVSGHTGVGTRDKCAVCHYDAVALMNVTSTARWDYGHRNNVLDIFTTNNLSNDLGFIAPYDKGIKGGYYKGIYTSIYDGNEPSADNVCTATYCHGAGDSPIWGSGSTTCTSCHSTPPAGGVHGTHSQGYIGHKSNSSGTTYDFGCFKCHSDTANHASGPVNSNRAALVNFNSYSTPMNPSGSYVEGAFQGTDNGFDWTNGTCSNLYCHSNGQGGSPNTTPTWNGSMAANCAGCHNGLAVAGSPMSSGKHTKHITSSTYNFGCDKCHNDTTTSGTAITDTLFHVNSSVDVAFDGQNPLGSFAGTTCSTLYCHGDGVSNGNADWTGGATGCTSCHDYDAAATPNTISTGKHTAHIDNGNLAAFGCSVCHKRTVNIDNATIIYTNSRHVNGTKNVEITFNSLTGFYQGDFTCRNVYCHSSGQATPNYRTTDTWTGAVTADCDYCHGADGFYSLVAGAPDYENISSSTRNSFNSHQVHAAADADCVKCHDTTVDVSKAILTTNEHLSGARDVSFVKGGSYSNKRCTNTDCHGVTSMRWGGSLPASCNSCHTDQSAGTNGSHDYTGKHSTHTNTYGFACEVCHTTKSATGNTDHSSGDVSTNHAAEVFFNTSATVWTDIQYDGGGNTFKYIEMDTAFGLSGITPSYTPWTTATPLSDPINSNRKWTEGRCGNIWCHSNANPMGGAMTYVSYANWSTAETTGCTSCHGGPGTAASITLSDAHKMHAGSDRYGFTCSKCHNVTVSSGNSPISNYTTHVNKTKDVDFDGTNGSGSYTSPTCSTLYCHGNGDGSTGGQDWDAGSMACTSCHNYTVASGSAMATGKHTAHINNGNIGVFECADCHSRTVASNNTTIQYALGKHVDTAKTVAVSFNSLTGFYQGDFTCRNVYCHSSGQATPNYRTTDTWTGAVTADCDYCHGADGFYSLVAGAPDYENISSSTRNSFNSHQVHVAADADCVKCHDTTVDVSKAILTTNEHLSGARDVSFVKGGSYSNKRCTSTDCHGATTMRWGGSLPASCDSCHSDQGAGTNGSHDYTGKHSAHTDTYRFACEVCHTTKSATGNTDHSGGDVSTNHAAEVFFNTSATVWTDIQYDGGGTTLRYVQMDAAFGLTGLTPTYTPWTTATPQSDPLNTNRKWTEGRCGTVWCHSNANPMGGTMTYVSFANWSSSETTACTSCHGGPGTQASITLSNAHKMHAGSDRYNFTCSKCHNVTVSSGNSPISNYTTHVNGAKNIDFDSTNGSGSYSNPTCSTLYCHGNGNGSTGGQDWDAGSMSCTSCHNYTVASGSAMATGKHSAHINNGNIGVFECADCHSRTVASNNTTIQYSLGKHVDTSKTVALSFNSLTGFYVTASHTCRNAYCHSSGQINPVYQNTPDWTGASTLTCDSCHGAEGASYVAGAPEYANVSTADRNTFNGHYVSSHVSAATDCIKCHNATVDAAGAIKASSNHLDGTRTVSFLLGGSYDNATKRCSGTDSNCHGASTMRWGGSATCIDCHTVSGSSETDDYVYGTAPKATINFEEWTSAGHGKTGTYRYTGNSGANKVCEDCHSTTPAHGQATNPFRLMSSATIMPSVPNTLCESCHTSASIQNHDFSVVAQGTWNWTPKCVDCHDPHGDTGGYTSSEYNGAMIQRTVSYTASNTYGVPGTTEAIDFPDNYARAKSLSAFNWSSFVSNTAGNKGICRVCHTEATTNYFDRTTYTGTHNNDQGSCEGCHGHSVGFKPAACDGCHGYPPSTSDSHIDNNGAVGAHDKHVNGLGLSCYDCHKGNTHNQLGVSAPYTSIVTPGFVNISVTSTYNYVGNQPTYNGTPGSWSPDKNCSNVGCHYGDSIEWDCQ